MTKTILVTGANGFIGKVVVEELLRAEYVVLAMVRPGSIPGFDPHPQLSVLFADITNYESYSDRVKRVDVVVHLAANKYHPKLSFAVNLAGAHNLVRLVEEKRLRGRRIINISSQSTKIRYRGVYGESKRQSDAIIESSNVDWTTLKPSLVYGAGSETLFQTIHSYVEKLPFIPVIGNGRWELYPIAAVEVAQAIIKTIEKTATIQRVYDLGTPLKITFDGLIKLIQKEVGITKPIIHIPALLGLMGVYVVTKLIPSFPLSVDNVLGSTQNTACDPEIAIKELDLKLMSIEHGIKKYVGAVKTRGVRIAMVGLGKMGIMHSSILSTLPDARIVALVDQDESLGQTARSMGIAADFYPSLAIALKHQKIEGVFICTPTFAHKEIIELCMKHQIPFFVEKPVFTEYSDFALTKLASKGNVQDKSVAGYFWVYKREVAFTKELLEKQVIGNILHYRVTLKHGEVFGPKKGWLFKKKLSGGGVLANPGPHAFSIIQHLIGLGSVTKSSLEYIYKNEVEDKATVLLKHTGGILGRLDANWSVPNHPVMSIDFTIVGTKGAIIFAKNTLTLVQGKKKQVWRYFEIPFAHSVYNLNPKSGGEAYYLEDSAFIAKLSGQNTDRGTDLSFAHSVEKMISEAYAKA